MTLRDRFQESIPLNAAVIVGLPGAATVAEWLALINPVLQAMAYAVAIAWGLRQLWMSYRRTKGK